MAKKFCIPRALVQKLKDSAIKGEIKIKDLYTMSSSKRREFFTAKTQDENLGKLLNTEFEKAISSKQKDALKNWAESVFKPEEKKGVAYKNVIDKINQLDELGILRPGKEEDYLSDLVREKLGATVSADEVKEISRRATSLQEKYSKVEGKIGNPDNMQENIDFFKERADMDKYLKSLVPTHKLKVLTSTIGRGTMLASIKSPFLNIESNTIHGITEAFARRIETRKIQGANNKLATDWVKMASKIYDESGYDISRMLHLKEGQKRLGEKIVHAEGPGVVRKVGRFYEDFVFNKLLGKPDAIMAQVHFADSANIYSLKMAESKGLKGADAKKYAEKIMRDALSIEPKTADGEILKAQAFSDATYGTYTNDSALSKLTLKLREVINDATGDARLGDQFAPFVKTPANVISAGLESSGGGFVGLFRLQRAIKEKTLSDPQVISNIVKPIIRNGLGLTTAYLIASQFKPEEFMGEYDPARAQIAELKNKNYSAIKIGGKWVSIDYFGPIGVPLSALLYAKKYGKDKGIGEKVFEYGKGVGNQFYKLPVISLYQDVLKSGGPTQIIKDLPQSSVDFIVARTIPSMVSDIAKMTDSVERETTTLPSRVTSKIPVLRNQLPSKLNVLGQEKPTESAVSTLLFGSRVKTENNDPVINELDRLNESGNNVPITDFSKSRSKTVSDIKNSVSTEEYRQIRIKYGKEVREAFNKEISLPRYEKADDLKKKNVLNNIEDKILTKYKKKYVKKNN